MKKILLLLLFVVSLTQAKFNIYSSNDINIHIGEIVAVKGTLYEVYQSSKGNTFLNIDGSYPNQKFAGVIFNENTYKFDISKLRSKIGTDIIIKGFVKTYRGKPEIIIREKNQIINY
jgi:DNA/RNA endonuclease YhcR with UshA esterase domain